MKISVTNSFDVWGNKKEGWEVNNWCADEYDVRKFDIFDKKSVLRFLKRIDFLLPSVRVKSLTWEETDRGWIIAQASDDCPVCFVEERRK